MKSHASSLGGAPAETPARPTHTAGHRSMRATLLWWLIPSLLAIMLTALPLSYRALEQEVNMAYDRSLAGALRAIDLNIQTTSGGLGMEQPYAMFEFFELTSNGPVFFRVATEDGLAEIGSPAMPMPSDALEEGKPVFYDAIHNEEPVRIATLIRQPNPPLATREATRLIVQVAESLESRRDFMHTVLWRSLARDLAGLVFSILIVTLGIVFALRPLERLRRELENRSEDDLRPVNMMDMPAEVMPLLDALNHHMERYARQGQQQRQFLDDASHQLRTPLSVLRTQLDYALRESDPAELKSALGAMGSGLDRAERMVRQMLSLARARDASSQQEMPILEAINLAQLARTVVRDLLPAARVRNLDYGFEQAGEDSQFRVLGNEFLLREAMVNLIDNAIRYSPPGGELTVSMQRSGNTAAFIVTDNGPGMSAADIELAGVRFRRGSAGKQTTGAGLGLAIVKTIAELHHATLLLENARPASFPLPDGSQDSAVSAPIPPPSGLRAGLLLPVLPATGATTAA